jgi:transposase
MVSVPGVGPSISRTLIAELPYLGTLGTLDRRQVTALAGFASHTRRSGQWRGKDHIADGRAPVRTAVFVGAMDAARHNPILKAFYERLTAAGKPKMVGAVARRLLTILSAIIGDQKP